MGTVTGKDTGCDGFNAKPPSESASLAFDVAFAITGLDATASATTSSASSTCCFISFTNSF